MKRVLIILANYYPHPSSVANCMKPLIASLSENYHVDILTNRKDVNNAAQEKHNHTMVYRVDDYRAMATMHLNELNKVYSGTFLKGITKAGTLFLKTLYFLKYSLFARERITGGWSADRVYEKFQELDREDRYDLVISVSLPFQSHYIAEKIKDQKGKDIKWIVFQFDPFAYNEVIKVTGKHRTRMFADEKRIFAKCDEIILTPELYEYYRKKDFIDEQKKVHELAFANLEPLNYDAEKVTENFMKEGRINCLFTGLLYGDIRNPDRLLKLFSGLDDKIHLSMLTNWSASKVAQHAPDNYRPTVIPFQNRDTALFNLTKADVLVNIGNTVELQVPGKIFEYMSSGKPIVHISKMEADPVLKYLQHYPKVLVINEWEISRMNYTEKLEHFCRENVDTQMSFDEISRSLGEYSGEQVRGKFLAIVNRVLGEKQTDE